MDSDKSSLRDLVEALTIVYPGVEINAFSDPLLAVKYGRNNKVDAVFTEINMNYLSGYDVVRLIQKEKAPPISVFFVSEAEAFTPDTQSFTLIKPVTPDAVKRALDV